MSALTPDERAHHDALAEAVGQGVHGEEALRCADMMRGTLWFQTRTLHYAMADALDVIRQTLPGRLIVRVARWVLRPRKPRAFYSSR